MVMRETSGFSVRPTVSESILKARRRNSDATRVSTPGLFSTYTTYVFSMCSLFVASTQHFYSPLLLIAGGLDNFTGPPDHLVQRCSRRHHGIYRVLLLHPEIDEHRSVMLPCRPHRGHDLRAVGHGHAANAISFAEFGEVRIEQRRGGVIAFVKEFLPLPHHFEKSVI